MTGKPKDSFIKVQGWRGVCMDRTDKLKIPPFVRKKGDGGKKTKQKHVLSLAWWSEKQ